MVATYLIVRTQNEMSPSIYLMAATTSTAVVFRIETELTSRSPC